MNRYVVLQVLIGALAISMLFVGDPLTCGIAYIAANARFARVPRLAIERRPEPVNNRISTSTWLTWQPASDASERRGLWSPGPLTALKR